MGDISQTSAVFYNEPQKTATRAQLTDHIDGAFEHICATMLVLGSLPQTCGSKRLTGGPGYQPFSI